MCGHILCVLPVLPRVGYRGVCGHILCVLPVLPRVGYRSVFGRILCVLPVLPRVGYRSVFGHILCYPDALQVTGLLFPGLKYLLQTSEDCDLPRNMVCLAGTPV